MTKRKLSVSLEDLSEILNELQNIVNKVTQIIPKVEDTIGNLIEKEEILDNRSQIYEDVFEGD